MKKELRFELPFETVPKKNSRMITSHRSIVSPRYRAWHTEALAALLRQHDGEEPISKECAVSILFVHGDKKRRDSDNQISSILDVLQDARILADDNWKIVKRIKAYNFYKKGVSKAVIHIEYYADETIENAGTFEEEL